MHLFYRLRCVTSFKTNSALLLPDNLELNNQKSRSLAKLKVTACTRLHPGVQNWVEKRTGEVWAVLIELYDQLYTK